MPHSFDDDNDDNADAAGACRSIVDPNAGGRTDEKATHDSME